MSYRNYAFYEDILVNEIFFIATHNKKLVRHGVLGKEVVCLWTGKKEAEAFLKKEGVEYDRLHQMDIDRFVTYELDEVFDEGDEVLVNPSGPSDGELIDVVKVTSELMSDLDNIRVKEFVRVVAKEDAVYGLSKKGQNQFIMISDGEEEKPNIMPVWSLKKRAEAVRQEDFEECEIIEVEGEVFGEWLDELRDDDNAVAIDLKTGVVGTVVPAQKVANELTF
ncbi:DUF2750 domain-containing protein [Staphylococcus sp. SQ8-PEA]|uniref:DUF2750 domain-containing protein n=1 Tax=Staphylococcus marylandisciuri TaxID=2981529 RepID=A0ABT2QRI4_9STAP|nr:DUF2750 domain-containing protein [Staphylococcus marylandisciuri]MCU5746595.1 DUF2750 domain-containing protein [Staphylococcus marylandisciuri]